MSKQRGRAVPIYRPGINMRGEVTIPTHDIKAADGRVLLYHGHTPPQARVSGAVLARAALFGLHVIEVTPSQAKRALTGAGDATKEEMQRAAACYGVSGEHAADALGVAKFAVGRIEVMA